MKDLPKKIIAFYRNESWRFTNDLPPMLDLLHEEDSDNNQYSEMIAEEISKRYNNFDKMKEALNRVVEDSQSEDYFGGISNATFKEIKQLLESIK